MVPRANREGADHPFTSIDHVQLAMPQGKEDEARAFYADVLGMTESAKPAKLASRGGVWFQSGDALIHLGVAEPFVPATKAHPALVCANYDALLTRLRSDGVTILADDPMADGRPHCYISDPFGNRIELIRNAR